MEKRLLLAIVLSFLILFLYQAVFVKKQPPPEPSPETTAALTQTPEKPPQALQPPPPQKETAAPAEQEPVSPDIFQPVGEQSEESITVNTELYQAVWSNKGAVLKSWRLKEHKDENGEDLELVSNDTQTINIFPFAIQTDDPAFDNIINTAFFKPSRSTLQFDRENEAELSFEYADELGNRAQKTFVFRNGVYDFDIRISVWKNGQQIEPRLLWGPKIGNPAQEAANSRFGGGGGVTVYTAAKAQHHEARKYKPEKSVYNFVEWAAYDDRYFAALFVTSPQQSSALFIKQDIEQIPYYFLSVNFVDKAYIGPKSFDILSKFGHETKRIVRFGFFGFIAEILYSALKAVHNIVPNWGWSIIVLTLLVKILFFPLTYSSTKSMAKMQELQPKIKALKAKYKKAKQDIDQRRKMNEETMKLYKEHGVNPAGGCLPMLIQLPIFWGFFRLLIVAIEFRHAPFMLWLTDLSVKDPYYITPILMGITQFISQKMTPTTGDSTQQKMMLIMPVVMTIFFMNFQSGLVLYWLTNNVLQIGQQYIMNRLRKKQKVETHGKRRKK